MNAETPNQPAVDLLNYEITTWKGHRIDFREGPTVDQIDIEDIAHHLALQCRFMGAVNRFYSIAEHSIYVARHTAKMHGAYFLLHDAHEYLYQDICKPLKNFILSKSDVYEKACDQADKVIMKALGLNYIGFKNLYPRIKEVDNYIYDLEHKFLRGRFAPVPSFAEGEPLHGAPFGMAPEEAEAIFLQMFHDFSK